ncbi:hypothetical protein BH09BAC1_BH09BAC1_07390 [soil metagenome]
MKAVFILLAPLLFLASCNNETGLPLQHAADCRFSTPEALATSIALCLRDADFTCASSYMPGMGNINGQPQAEHLLVTAFKDEIANLRTQITQRGGDLTKLKLLEVTQNDQDVVLKITMHLKAGKLRFTMQPVGLFQSEGSWFLLGSGFEVGWE